MQNDVGIRGFFVRVNVLGENDATSLYTHSTPALALLFSSLLLFRHRWRLTQAASSCYAISSRIRVPLSRLVGEIDPHRYCAWTRGKLNAILSSSLYIGKT